MKENTIPGVERSMITAAVVLAALMSVFFVSGFAVHQYVNGSATGNVAASAEPDTAENQGADKPAVSQDEAVAKAEQYLLSTLPPFVRNATTVAVEKDTRIEGTDYLYDWTVRLAVEPNAYGQWATNTTTFREFTFYLSKNGEYLFKTPPEPTDVQQRGRPMR